MKAFALAKNTAPFELEPVEMDIPTPGDGELLIEVHAGGITPSELLWYPTTHTKDGEPRQLAVPGHEFSGIVKAIGKKVSRFRAGDPIFGMSDWFAQGSTAEFCLASEATVIPKPSTLKHAQAAALPISGLTAWQGLFLRASAKAGEHVVVVGAAGSVGLMVVQLAVHANCRVTAVAEERHRPLLKNLGCTEIVDYKTQRFENAVSDVDVLFDSVGADTLERARPLLTPTGRMVTIAADAEGKVDPVIRDAFFIVQPSASQLQEFTTLFEQSNIQIFVKACLRFAQAGNAYSNAELGRGSLGKLVFTNDQVIGQVG